MKASLIFNNIQRLDKERQKLANAIALSLIGDSPQYVTDRLVEDYKKLTEDYYDFIDGDYSLLPKEVVTCNLGQFKIDSEKIDK